MNCEKEDLNLGIETSTTDALVTLSELTGLGDSELKEKMSLLDQHKGMVKIDDVSGEDAQTDKPIIRFRVTFINSENSNISYFIDLNDDSDPIIQPIIHENMSGVLGTWGFIHDADSNIYFRGDDTLSFERYTNGIQATLKFEGQNNIEMGPFPNNNDFLEYFKSSLTGE
ncbi:MAG: hypothetical protein HOE30_00170 [Deltaproteobacteria bacterium]|jgi:hypothetical protein|nr:hypothetical protein [Deltaproteobacteria bacterium]MBT4384351.1 hypothetical protein [Candidatus Peregrinibacteria bacterium]MBT4632273.1 hypothetical protein [Candidatus Peregrinibacteria bacterium]MBT5516621.1 hypothetical protein [Candidatus Peregrinibacteria bacterium]MBT5824316.1 hypothetical protein [Candidatus Peregrinibacteria bacterium]